MIHRIAETPPEAGITQADPKQGSQTAPTPGDLVDQKARDRDPI